MVPTQQPLRRPLPFPRRKLDNRGVEIVHRLQKAGYEAYFVGGCVRDLLLDRDPKDFDIATSARPRAIQRIFRRAQIIGRRFRLVHVHMGSQIFEVSTFRKAPPAALGEEAKLIKTDNIFGTAQEDALRRDFTVNGLFVDPRKGEIVDYVGGLEDVHQRVLHAIGEPLRRFREDPVRVLRLIKFMRRLELTLGAEEVEAARETAPYLKESAPPRVAEEVFRLMVTGDMVGVLADLEALDALHLVLPDIAKWMRRSEDGRKRLNARLAAWDQWLLDGWFRHGGPEPSYGLRLAVLYGPMVEEELNSETRTVQAKDLHHVPGAVFAELQSRARLPRAVLDRASRILRAQWAMDPPPGVRERLSRWDPKRQLGLDFFPDALDSLHCCLQAEGRDPDVHDAWQERYLAHQKAGGDDAEED